MPVSQRRHFGIVVALILTAFVIYYPFSPGGRQRINMNRAQKHIDRIAQQVKSDSRFVEITMISWTAYDGSIGVRGELKSAEDAEALRHLIESTNPPVDVNFSVELAQASAPGKSTRERRVEIQNISRKRE